ncbi:DUF3710 domain-containing protein [Nocardioides marmotae]|uniref:DUF3710 domain-containing protein n=1 Tax=Nocardioides marmotae TaxID=2663857 RepID=UPI00132078EF|nr:DUF3710 domain-containing protein [Nocardioides marmotae]MBC9731957.1 DUF3710 domain-containing protein [Nocardioides marmotae]MTB83078.1 DUF3710 domain-containing protein [Nocardioides marmotae]
MKFRRKSADPTSAGGSTGADAHADEAAGAEVPTGPYDSSELPPGDGERVDLGSLLIAAAPGRELRLQVDERTGEVQAVLLTGSDGALELRAFAAPRNGDLWSELRPRIVAEMAQRGGTATERPGRFGTELLCDLPVTLADGQAATQPSRIIGIDGPRWLLRATLLGRPAVDPEAGREWEDVITTVAVHRGTGAVPPGDPLPVTMPESARRLG